LLCLRLLASALYSEPYCYTINQLVCGPLFEMAFSDAYLVQWNWMFSGILFWIENFLMYWERNSGQFECGCIMLCIRPSIQKVPFSCFWFSLKMFDLDFFVFCLFTCSLHLGQERKKKGLIWVSTEIDCDKFFSLVSSLNLAFRFFLPFALSINVSFLDCCCVFNIYLCSWFELDLKFTCIIADALLIETRIYWNYWCCFFPFHLTLRILLWLLSWIYILATSVTRALRILGSVHSIQTTRWYHLWPLYPLSIWKVSSLELYWGLN